MGKWNDQYLKFNACDMNLVRKEKWISLDMAGVLRFIHRVPDIVHNLIDLHEANGGSWQSTKCPKLHM